MLKKSVGLIFLFIFLINIVSSAETIIVQQQPPSVEKKGFLSNTFGFLKSPIFWYIVIGFIVILGILIGIFFLIKWLVKFLKSQSNVFYQFKLEKMKLAKVQRRYNSNHFLKVRKNTPIRLVRLINGIPNVSQPIAYHRGDFTTHEGNVVLSMNLKDNKKWFILPITDLLIIPDKDEIELTIKNEKGKKQIIVVDNLPRAKDIIHFNEGEILIYAESLSNMGMFYIPVLKTNDGKIIDLSLPVFQSIRQVVLENYLFEQTDEFSKVSKKAIDMNPNLRYATKSADANSSVEVPSNNPK